jgi:hypothetical protein
MTRHSCPRLAGKEFPSRALSEPQNWAIVFRDLVSMVLSLLMDGCDNVVCHARNTAVDLSGRTRPRLVLNPLRDAQDILNLTDSSLDLEAWDTHLL